VVTDNSANRNQTTEELTFVYGEGTTTTPPVENDSKAPTVSFTSPVNGAVLKGNGGVNISVAAADESGIGSIVVSIDGTAVTTCKNTTTCTYTWNGKSITSGQHTISVVVIDNSTNKNQASASAVVTK
jgi:hypothetical protein